MITTPKSLRLHIGIFGRRNVGKSSLLNAVTRQQVSIVSDVAGTTTDPVEKPMEFLPLGPVLFIDTAGIDDVGALGEQRIARTHQVLERTEIGIVVAEAGKWGEYEDALLSELAQRKIPAIAVINKSDLISPEALSMAIAAVSSRCRTVGVSAATGAGISELRQALLENAPPSFLEKPPLVGDLVGEGGMAVLVVPIDKEAPRGRLILPQVQAIRDLLDHNAFCTVVKETELRAALGRLALPPCLVVTDSQAFLKVAADTPPDVPLTSFSILLARAKGDLESMVQGALAIGSLRGGDRVLIAEACSHHPIADDIGRVKIPRWLAQRVGAPLEFSHVQGHDFPQDLSNYRLVVHCGACMLNRREVLSRIMRCREQGVPITNYGLAIAYSLGILERALSPFPSVLAVYRQAEEKSREPQFL